MSLSGRLLVATPALTEANFDRTVVLVLEHNDHDGALGLVLNRPTDIDADDPIPGWGRLAAAPGVVFVGGPVQATAAIALGRLRPEVEPAVDEVERAGVVVVDRGAEPDAVAARMAEIRLYAGYAGWGPGQLDDEIAEQAWFVVDAEPGDALTSNPGELWRSVMRRQPGRLSWLGTFPDDVASN